MTRREQAHTRTARDPHEDAGLLTLGRLLLVGVGAGLMIGGLTAAALTRSADYAAVGAMVGLVVGPTVQILNAVLVHLARTVRPNLGVVPLRVLLLILTGVVTGALTWVISNGRTTGPPLAWPMILAVLLSGVTAWLASPWCLAPITAPGVARG